MCVCVCVCASLVAITVTVIVLGGFGLRASGLADGFACVAWWGLCISCDDTIAIAR